MMPDLFARLPAKRVAKNMTLEPVSTKTNDDGISSLV